MRILYLLTDGFGGHGGIALYNRDMLKALADAPRVTAISAVPRIAAPFTESLPAKVRWYAGAGASASAFVARAFREALRLRPGDLIYCAHLNLLPLAAALKIVTGARLALAIYGTESWTRGSRSQTLGLRVTDSVVSISAFTLDRFVGWSGYPRDRTTLLPNAIDLARYGDAPRRAGLVERYRLAGHKTLLILGRMHPTERQKGFDELLQALPAIRRETPGAVAILAGDGGDRARLEALAGKLGIADAVRFTGLVDEAEKADLYRLADAYVMPSYQEGFGFVHLEAMACGTPVVASNADGAREAVRKGALGVLIDPHDRADIVRGVREALARPRGIPPGLNYFAFPHFAERAAAWLARLVGAARAHP